MNKLRIYILLVALTSFFNLKAQTTLFFQDFEGAITNIDTSATDEGATVGGGFNHWTINNAYTGGSGSFLLCAALPFPAAYMIVNTPAQPAGITSQNGNYMHIICDSVQNDGILSSSFRAPDGFCMNSETYFTKMTTDINTTNFTGVNLKFWWLCEGGGSDFTGEVYYSTNGGSTWTKITSGFNSGNYNGQGTWVQETLSDAVFSGQSQLRFGFRFITTSASSQTPTDPPFSIDDILIQGTPTSPSCGNPNVIQNSWDMSDVCSGTTRTYSVTTHASNTIQWSVPSGGTIIGSSTNSSVQVQWNTPPTGQLKVRVDTACGDSTVLTSSINILSAPSVSSITGTTNLCANVTGEVYSVTNNTSSTYTWTVTGGTISSGQGTSSINVNWGSGPSGTVKVVESNGCSPDDSTQISITVTPSPSVSSITGNSSLCANAAGEAYSVTNNTGSTYTWTVTGGTISSGQGTNSINVNWGSGPSGTVKVVESNGCSPDDSTQISITVTPSPSVSSITGNASLCANAAGEAYSVTNNTGSTYTWTVTGGTISSGQGTNSISVNWGAGPSGTVKVVESNGCSPDDSTQINITFVSAPSVSSITGTTNLCANVTGEVYSVTNNTGSTYTWTVTGGTISSGQGTSSISVNWGAGPSGTVKVVESNGCSPDDSTQISITVTPSPSVSSITGNSSLCANAAGEAYSVTNNTGSTYTWTVTGGTISSGQGTNSISVNWGAGPSGTVKVVESNGCSPDDSTQINITLAIPPTVGTLSGASSVCANQTNVMYSVLSNPNITGYNWTIIGGTPVSGGALADTFIVINWGAGPTGTVKILEQNACGADSVVLTVNMTPGPTTSGFTGTTTVCQGDTMTYSVTNNATSTYTWTATNGTIISGQGTNSVSVLWNTVPSGSIKVVESNGCAPDDSITTAITINNCSPTLPTASFTIVGDKIGACAPVTVDFVNTSTNATNYVFYFGDGDSLVTTTTGTVQHSYLTSGNYTVMLVASNGTSFDTAYNVNNVIIYPNPIADFTILYDYLGNVVFQDSSQDAWNWSWTFGDGGTSTDQNPSNQYTANGIYNVTLVVTNAYGCSDTISKPVTVGTVGIYGDLEEGFSFKVFPNPFQTQINLDISSDKDLKISAELYDVFGKKIKSFEQNTVFSGNHNLALKVNENIAKGVYLLKLNVNSKEYLIKLLKQN